MKSFKILVILSFVFFLFSCSKDETQEQPQDTSIALHVLTPGITESEDSLELTRATSSVARSQMVSIAVGNDMILEATLDQNRLSSTRATTTLAVGVKYRVIVFKQDDVSPSGYISYADYEVGITGAIAGELHVPVAGTYTFVCYSLSNAGLPVFSQTTLDVAANPATDDLLYAKFNQSITAASATLTYNFVHKFSLVTVVADATSIAKNISAIVASLSPNYPGTLTLADGRLTAGTATPRPISWGSIAAAQTINSSPCAVFVNGSSSVTVSIPSITIGGVIRTNLTATFGSNIMQAGAKYTLRLKFKLFEGVSLVGLTWAPGNLIYSGGTYYFASTQEYYSGVWNGGDYWGWCQLDPTTVTTYGYSGNYSLAVDPCQQVAPVGTWRMPTSAEMYNLIDTGNVLGTKNGINGCYFGTTIVPTTNLNNYLFLPAAGNRGLSVTTMYDYTIGVDGFYWTSTPYDNLHTLIMYFPDAPALVGYGGRSLGVTIRCVK